MVRAMPRDRRNGLPFRILFRTARLFDLAGRGLFYFAVGMLRRVDLEQMSSLAWEDFGDDAHVAATGLMSWERTIFAEFLRPSDRVLLVGSGSGRDLLALLRDGHDVVGIEQASLAVERARRLLQENGFSAHIVETSVNQAQLPGTFDVVVFSWFCYSYILGSDDRIAALVKVRDHLNPHGRIVVSYLGAEKTAMTRTTTVARFASRVSGADWRAIPNDHFYPIPGTSPLFVYQHSFGPGELQKEARKAGLSVLAERRFPEAFLIVLTRESQA
jgi:SAM-dependent methyltransferase